jgi:predicted DNA-binding transcriptional regulator YafY
VNRTDRLYAIVEELRVVAPRPRSAAWLATRFEISARTAERDISTLQQSGVPIWAEPGRTGGYCLDPVRSLPPVNFTPDEAVAMTIALQGMATTPFRAVATSALRKLVAAMAPADAAAASALVERIHFLEAAEFLEATEAVSPMRRDLVDAITSGRVVRMVYGDRVGNSTTRDVEPMGYVVRDSVWYLIAWCRSRDAIRAFRTDRILDANPTAEVAEPREFSSADLRIPYGDLKQLSLR